MGHSAPPGSVMARIQLRYYVIKSACGLGRGGGSMNFAPARTRDVATQNRREHHRCSPTCDGEIEPRGRRRLVTRPSEDQPTGEVKTSSVDRAYQHIRQAIISGEYPPNSPLRLQRIASEAGVSIIPVREALRTLEGERLVRSEPNRGAVVAGVSLQDARDAYHMRILLETEAVRRAYEHLRPEDLERVRSLADEHLERLSDDGHGHEAVHRELHFAIYGRCGSEWLLRFIQTLWDHTERYRRVGRPPARVTGEHLAIVEALEQGEVDTAVDAIREHLLNTLRATEKSPYIEDLADAEQTDA